jgi:hypothetical protein
MLRLIIKSNEPGAGGTGRAEGLGGELAEVAASFSPGPAGVAEPLLRQDEMRLLLIPSGTLDAEERKQIESHVLHTFRFLSQIPWTRELKNVPEIARHIMRG